MKTHTSKDGMRRAWYDPQIGDWVLQKLDANGNQIPGEVDYAGLISHRPGKIVAKEFLEGEIK